MRHVDERCAEPIVQLRKLGSHVHAELGVEVGQRLVHQECRGMTHHRSPKRHALALAAGELRRPALEQRVDLQLLRDRAHFAFDFRHDAAPSRRQHPNDW